MTKLPTHKTVSTASLKHNKKATNIEHKMYLESLSYFLETNILDTLILFYSTLKPSVQTKATSNLGENVKLENHKTQTQTST